MKRPTWPEDRWPTPVEWLDWLLEQDREDQETIAVKVLAHSERQMRCFVENHDALAAENRDLIAGWLDEVAAKQRYRLAWLSARRRGRGVRDALRIIDSTWRR